MNRLVAHAFLVDYSQTRVDVYIKVGSYLLKDQGRIDLLLHKTDPIRNIGVIPSWVPQWDWKGLHKPLRDQPWAFSPPELRRLASSWFSPPTQGFRPLPESLQRLMSGASIRQDPQFTLDICPRDENLQSSIRVSTDPALPCLRIRAHYVDTITSIVPNDPDCEMAGNPPPAYGLRGCVHCETEGRHTLTQMSAFESDEWDTYLPKKCPDKGYGDPKAWQRFSEAHKAFRELITSPRPTGPSGEEWAFFLTDQSVGFARAGTPGNKLHSDDSIWILAGLNVPMVLRRMGGYYVLVKECQLYRVTERHECIVCGGTEPWPMLTQVIDIW